VFLAVLKQGTGTTTRPGGSPSTSWPRWTRCSPTSSPKAPDEGLESARARGRVGGRKPKVTARQAGVARGMYDETGDGGRRKYTVAEIAETFGVARKTVYRHLVSSGGRRQPGKSAGPAAPAEPLATPPHPIHARISEPGRQSTDSPRCRAGPPGLPDLRARTHHQARGSAASPKPGTAWYASRTGPSSTSAAPAAATAP